MKIIMAIISLFCASFMAQAETRYIVDQALLPMRSGQSTQYKIIRMLPSGMQVEVLQRGTEGYTQIKTPEGKEGWILDRYLMKTPSARDRLAKLEKDLARMDKMKQEKKASDQERNKLKAENKKLDRELKLIRKTAADAVEIARENETLNNRAVAAEAELESLRQETQDIRSGAATGWFVLGAGAILLGIVLGLILPNLRFRRKSRWGEI
jgi:SH3 domain protein